MEERIALNAQKKNVKLSKYALYFVLAALIIVFTVLRGTLFMDASNWFNMLLSNNSLLLVSIGMTFVLVAGMMDLSVGSIAYLAAVVPAMLIASLNFPIFPAFLIGFGVGALIGVINCVFIIKLKMNPMITTLGMMIAVRALATIFSKSKMIALPKAVGEFGLSKVFGVIPTLVLITIVILIVAQIILSYTKFGRHVMAIGSNEKAAKVVGININKIKVAVLMISACLAALAGIFGGVTMGLVNPRLADGYEFLAISIVVLGGTSLAGGHGSIVPNTILGFLIVCVIENGLALMGVPTSIYPIIRGAIIFAAMYVDTAVVKSSKE